MSASVSEALSRHPSSGNATGTSMLEKYSAEQFFIQLSLCYTQLQSMYALRLAMWLPH